MASRRTHECHGTRSVQPVKNAFQSAWRWQRCRDGNVEACCRPRHEPENRTYRHHCANRSPRPAAGAGPNGSPECESDAQPHQDRRGLSSYASVNCSKRKFAIARSFPRTRPRWIRTFLKHTNITEGFVPLALPSSVTRTILHARDSAASRRLQAHRLRPWQHTCRATTRYSSIYNKIRRLSAEVCCKKLCSGSQV